MVVCYKAMTLNRKGLNNPIKVKRLSDWLTKERPNFVFLQETHQKRNDVSLLKSNWFQYQFYAGGSSKARRVAIAISKEIQVQTPIILRDPRGRYIFGKCVIDDTLYTLASIYAPNSGQIDFLKHALESLVMFQSGELLIGGDFNKVLDNLLDKTHGLKKHRTIRQQTSDSLHFRNLLTSYDLLDVWRFLYPTARQYTFYSNTHQTHSRTDMLLGSKSLFHKCDSVKIGFKFLSDHSWVSCSFSRRVTDDKGPNWTLNKALLVEELYRPNIMAEIEQFFAFHKDCGVSVPVVWDTFKAVMRGQLLLMATACKKEREKLVKNLKDKIIQLEKKYLHYGGQKNSSQIKCSQKKNGIS